MELIIDSIDIIFDYLHEVEEAEFTNNNQLQDACLMRLIVIGETATKIPEAVKQKHPEIEWREMIMARNFYVHAYSSVGWQQIWETIQTKLLPLRSKLARLLND